MQIFKIIQIFIKSFHRLPTKKNTNCLLKSNSYYYILFDILEIFIMREFLGLRRLNNRSILNVCEDYSIKRNDKITH